MRHWSFDIRRIKDKVPLSLLPLIFLSGVIIVLGLLTLLFVGIFIIGFLLFRLLTFILFSGKAKK
jgi:hypothetical protein